MVLEGGQLFPLGELEQYRHILLRRCWQVVPRRKTCQHLTELLGARVYRLARRYRRGIVAELFQGLGLGRKTTNAHPMIRSRGRLPREFAAAAAAAALPSPLFRE